MLLLQRLRIPRSLLPASLVPAGRAFAEPLLSVDLAIEGEKIVQLGLANTLPVLPETVVVNGHERIAFPAFIDAHVHLDKAHTWDRAPNHSGTFAEACTALGADLPRWTEADLLRRAEFSLRCAYAHGTRIVRTHVDTGLPWAETSHAVMAELRSRWAGRLELQTVPLCGIAAFSAPDGEQLVDVALRYGAVALGGFAVMSEDLPALFDRQLAIARERGVGLDLHVDENGDAGSHCLRLIAEAVLRHAFPHPVVCGHCCSLATQAIETQRSTIDLVREAGIKIISLPLCNLYLQDRRPVGFPQTPFWRGVTLIRDFQAAGVTVACASDNVRDAFYAYGDFDLMEIYAASVQLAHLDTALSDSIGIVTSAAAECVGRPASGRIEVGAPAQLVLTSARSFSELLGRPKAPRQCVDGETIHTPPSPFYDELG